ncbi:MAG: aromatic amino acid hydroxylase [Bacteroidetes bacterium]|nr:aromatic amino acid hydroxylase [Bacteroidota bacterium]
MEMNEVLEKLPKHLLNLMIDQPYNEYTPQDHALWRYVMKQNVRYLPRVAHHSYLDGLKKTGVSIDEIPHMYGMNRILKQIGWAAVAVDGFIPPAAFMEFQAYNVLVIAADIRPMDQIEYTPAPDIIHEAAGHAPIISDPQYAEYLRLFGKIGSRAFSSAKDYEIYNAIRHLSILKADPYSEKKDIAKAEKKLAQLQGGLITMSEMSLIRNLHWWTVEYGLIGDLRKPKIYGAGLLSSIGESYSSLQPEVAKIPYTIDAVNYNFDITNRQPQLFVTPDFETLTTVLNEFADRMALRKGGIYGLQKALESGTTSTIVYSSGLQVSGTVAEYLAVDGDPIWFRMGSPSALSYYDKQLEGHGKDYHKDGFSSPIGGLKNLYTPLEMFKDNDLKRNGIEEGSKVELEFESGLIVSGRLDKVIRRKGKIILMSFNECTVTYKDKVLFEPSWGPYDMAIGTQVVSAFQGPADPDAFGLSYDPPEEKTHKIVHNDEAMQLHTYYKQVREIRDTEYNEKILEEIYLKVKKDYPKEWLLPLEILELVYKFGRKDLTDKIQNHLENIKKKNTDLANVINNGMDMISESAVAKDEPSIV